ncbi:MAG: universal stress protein [Bacteroidia bacterium]
MSIALDKILIAAKKKGSCESAAKLAGRIASTFKAKLFALVPEELKNNILSTALIPGIEFLSLNNGSAHKQIKDTASNINPDLVVLPVSTNDSDEAVVTSKEANNIIDHLERMVLTVPAGNKDFNMLKIVVPIDTSFETRQKIPYAEAFARQFGSTIHVIGVSNDKGKDAQVTLNNYIRQVANVVSDHGFKCEVDEDIHLGVNPTDKTLEYAKKINAGLIIIMTEQESNLVSFFSGKYSEQMVKKSEIPVLSVHPRDLVVSEARL